MIMSAREPFIQSQVYHSLIWLIAISIVCAGIYLTNMEFLGAEWLSRAGCAIVILGIWSGLGAIVQERIILGRIKWQRRNAITSARARHVEDDADTETTDKEIDEINQAFNKQAEDLTQNLRYSLGLMEVTLLITGTFLWGFGDLLV